MEKISARDYRSELRPVWCPGCGDFGVLNSLYQALAQLQLPLEEVAVISGIGCSSRLPGYVKTYGFNSIHGRALPVAQGVKLARPETTVVVVTGDGDALSIGAGHFPHAARRNVDMTCIMMDNGIYGMTKGQSSPTTGSDQHTTTTPYGFIDEPLNPIKIALSSGATFIARGFSVNIKQSVDLIVQAIQHPGFAFVQLLSPCVTFVGREQFDILRSMVSDLAPDYDPGSLDHAWKLSHDESKLPLGVLYRQQKLEYCQQLQRIKNDAMQKAEDGFDAVVRQYDTAA